MKCFGDKVKSYHCKIVLLDETELIQEIQAETKGQDLLDVVFRHLNLIETPYFGLRFVDSSSQTHWLLPLKKVIRQLRDLNIFTLYFGVKFYASDPCKLLEEITRYQFFLQVKQDIIQGRLPVSFDLAAELFAYVIQSELGDYEPRRHQTNYISEFQFVPNQTAELEAKASELHKALLGQVPSVAELNFLEKVKWLDMYGIDLHPVLGKDSIEYYLGLTPSGVLVLRNKTKVGNYFWPRISKVYFKGKYFMLRVRDKAGRVEQHSVKLQNEEHTYGFELSTKKGCKHLWKCCVEHHAFFRLTQVREVPGHSGKVFTLGSRFSGRTEKQFQSDIRSSIRSQPTVVRVPSRRYQRRLGQPDGADAPTRKEESHRENGCMETKVNISVPQPVYHISMHRSTSMPTALARTDSPRSTRSAPWEEVKQRGLYSNSTNPSPRSARSSGSRNRVRLNKRMSSADSDSSYDSRRRSRRHRSRQSSDNDSEISKSSKGSKSSRAHKRDSGSDSDVQHRHSSRRKSRSQLVDSEAQWREVQKKQQENAYLRQLPQNAVIRDLKQRHSGYMNSGMETESEANYYKRKKHRKHRSRSKSPDSKKTLPDEMKQHIEYSLIDPHGMTESEMKDIKYTNIETDARIFKIRYSPKDSRSHAKVAQTSNVRHSSQQTMYDEDPPPPYSPLLPSIPHAKTTSSSNINRNGSIPYTNGDHNQSGMTYARNIHPKTSLSQSKSDLHTSNGNISSQDHGSSHASRTRLSNGFSSSGVHTPRVTFQTPPTTVKTSSWTDAPNNDSIRSHGSLEMSTEL